MNEDDSGANEPQTATELDLNRNPRTVRFIDDHLLQNQDLANSPRVNDSIIETSEEEKKPKFELVVFEAED